jgi:hypothetical protein
MPTLLLQGAIEVKQCNAAPGRAAGDNRHAQTLATRNGSGGSYKQALAACQRR